MLGQLKWLKWEQTLCILPTRLDHLQRIRCGFQWLYGGHVNLLHLGNKITKWVQHKKRRPAAVSPVGGGGVNRTPALPLSENSCWCSRTSKGIKLHLPALLSTAASLDLQPHSAVSALGQVWVHHHQLVVVPTVVVPEGAIMSLVLDAELYRVRGQEDLRYRDRKGEGVGVRAAIDVVKVQTWNVLEGAPWVKGDSDRDGLLKGEVSDLNSAWEQTLLYRTGLQANLLCFEPVPQVQIVCSWLDKVQNKAWATICSFWRTNMRAAGQFVWKTHDNNVHHWQCPLLRDNTQFKVQTCCKCTEFWHQIIDTSTLHQEWWTDTFAIGLGLTPPWVDFLFYLTLSEWRLQTKLLLKTHWSHTGTPNKFS